MPTILDLLNYRVRLFLLFSSLSALLFVRTYCSSVCPFIDGLSEYTILINLGGIFIFQMLIRELLYRFFNRPWKNHSLVRQAYYLSILSWMLAGIAASLLHAYLYPGFPTGSHIKLLSSYWILGAGILAQLEYVIFETRYKRMKTVQEKMIYKERLSRRIMESLLIFTLAPTVTMLLTIMRYNYEGVLSSKVIVEVLYIGSLTVFAAILVAFLMGKMLKDDTSQIIASIKKVEAGDFHSPLHLHRSDELEEISEGINTMAKGLRLREQIKEVFGRFVNPKTAEHIIEQYVKEDSKVVMRGEKRYAVILMADIRDFTKLSEKMAPDALLSLLNQYFSLMVDAIHEEEGVVDKFMGDAVMAVFGLPEQKESELAAVRCALRMRQKLSELNIHLQKEGTVTLDNGIGIHGGEVIAGYLGSEARLEFTVIGSPVNLASRIEQQTKKYKKSILISKQIREKVADIFECTFVDSVLLKGVTEAESLYSINPDYRSML